MSAALIEATRELINHAEAAIDAMEKGRRETALQRLTHIEQQARSIREAFSSSEEQR